MSRVGNSLDNWEIEYFFSMLKTEIFPIFQQKVRTLTFDELIEKLTNLLINITMKDLSKNLI